MYIVHHRVIVDNMCEFQHSSSHVDCNFDAGLFSKTRKYRSTKKLRKHFCQQILVSNNSKRPSMVNCISTNPECRSDHRWPVYKHSLVVSALSVIARLWALKFSPSGGGQSVFTKIRAASCHCFASCNCCHDPFIVRSAQNSSTAHWFHSACTSVSMFAINADNCLFLCWCFPGSLCSHRVCNPVTRSIIGSSPSSCSEVWDPRSVEYQSCKLAMLLQY